MAIPQPVTVLRGHEADIQALSFTETCEYMLSGDAKGQIRVWDLDDCRPITVKSNSLQGCSLHPVSAGVISIQHFNAPATASGSLLVTQGRDGATHIWSCSQDFKEISEQPIRSFIKPTYSFCRFSLLKTKSSSLEKAPSIPGSKVAQRPQMVADIHAEEGPACSSCCCSCSPSILSYASSIQDDHKDLETSERQSTFSPVLLAIAGDDAQQAEVWCCVCGDRLAVFDQQALGRKLGLCMALQLFYCPILHTNALAAGYEDGSVVLWNINGTDRPVIAQRKFHEEPVMALEIDPTGASGVCGSAEDKLACFTLSEDGKTIQLRHSIDLKKQGISDVKVRGDGKLVVTAGWDGRVRVYKYSNGKALAVLKYHTESVSALAFNSRFQLASGARDGTIALWDIYSTA